MAAQVGIEPTTKWLTVTCSAAELLGKMAGWTGLEPAVTSVTGWCFNQLSYHPDVVFVCQETTNPAEAAHPVFAPTVAGSTWIQACK